MNLPTVIEMPVVKMREKQLKTEVKITRSERGVCITSRHF